MTEIKKTNNNSIFKDLEKMVNDPENIDIRSTAGILKKSQSMLANIMKAGDGSGIPDEQKNAINQVMKTIGKLGDDIESGNLDTESINRSTNQLSKLVNGIMGKNNQNSVNLLPMNPDADPEEQLNSLMQGTAGMLGNLKETLNNSLGAMEGMEGFSPKHKALMSRLTEGMDKFSSIAENPSSLNEESMQETLQQLTEESKELLGEFEELSEDSDSGFFGSSDDESDSNNKKVVKLEREIEELHRSLSGIQAKQDQTQSVLKKLTTLVQGLHSTMEKNKEKE